MIGGIKQAVSELGKEAEIDEDVEAALKSTKKPFQRLGQGVIGDKFYYGTSLLWKGKQVSAVISSDRKVYLGLNYNEWHCNTCGADIEVIQPSYEKPKPPNTCNCNKRNHQDWELSEIINPIKDELGINYRTEFNDESIDYSWQTEDIKKYIERNKTKIARNHKQKSIREIYEEILNINKKYADHLNPAAHAYISCWIIATYCYTLFEQFGRIYFRAERGSGKTKQCRIIKFLAFNPMWITKGTESSIFRDAEATCGTFIVDNMDKLHEDLLRAMEHHIETGWMYDATYRLTNKDTGRTQKFLSYSPMGINNIFGLDENTIDKTFEITMLKSINPEIQRAKPTSKSEQWQEISNSIRCWVLDNWQEIQKTYENISSKFSGRGYDVAEAALTIAKIIGEDAYKNVESIVEEKIKEQFVSLENNPAYLIFNDIWESFVESPLEQERNIYLSDLADNLFLPLNPDLQIGTKDYTNKKKGCCKYIAKIIRAVPMFRKGGNIHGRTYITIKKEDLKRYMKLQKFLKDDEEIINEPPHLPTSTISTKPTKLPTSTNKVVDVVDLGDLVDVVDVEEDVDKKLDVEEIKI